MRRLDRYHRAMVTTPRWPNCGGVTLTITGELNERNTEDNKGNRGNADTAQQTVAEAMARDIRQSAAESHGPRICCGI